MTEIVVVDVGGTHARFALAEVADGRVAALGDALTLKTADYTSFQRAWEGFAGQLGRALPRAVAIAVACPVAGDVLKLTNNPWMIRPALLAEELGVDQQAIVNDFEAVGHAVAQGDAAHFIHLCGPELPLPERGTISVIGPGTGLGVAHVHLGAGGYHVQPTEGGHLDFAPVDAIDDAILNRLRGRYTRVSAERIICGPGIVETYEALAAIEGRAVRDASDVEIWGRALSVEDSLATAAMDRFCMSLGSFAGDIALAQGGSAVVIAGGLGLRLKDELLQSGFAERFRAKGRFKSLMESLPVKLITHPQPGLFGAAAAFARSEIIAPATADPG